MAPKRTTRRVARVVADDISRPNSGGSVKRVGPQTQRESQDLSGQNGRRANSVKQVGPSAIRPANAPTGKVKRAGAANWEDTVVVEGVDRPYSRQAGSVKQVGPADRSLTRLTEGTGGVGEFRSGRLPRSSGLITSTPLLVSGAGRKHPWAVFAGSPGSYKGNRAVRVSGGVGGSVLINGRSRAFGPEPLASTQVTPTGGNIVGGNVSDNTASVPTIAGSAASALAQTTATAGGTVNPKGNVTTYYIEYGTTTAYGNKGPTLTLPAGGSAVAVSRNLTGLTASTTYHFRIVAENTIGKTTGPDVSFSTTA